AIVGTRRCLVAGSAGRRSRHRAAVTGRLTAMTTTNAPAHADAALPVVDSDRVRADFPLLARDVHGKPLAYLDSANTGQKPASVIEAIDDFYRRHNANVSRAVHTLGTEATEAYEGARRKLARFLNVRADELVLCS